MGEAVALNIGTLAFFKYANFVVGNLNVLLGLLHLGAAHMDPVRLPQRDEKEHKPCYTFNEHASGKALLFRDSFARAWYPFLGQHFREVIYIWHPEWDRPLIEREKPDVVIDEMLERIFNEQDPVALARLDRMSETNSPILRASSPARYPDSPRTASSRTNNQNGSAR